MKFVIKECEKTDETPMTLWLEVYDKGVVLKSKSPGGHERLEVFVAPDGTKRLAFGGNLTHA